MTVSMTVKRPDTLRFALLGAASGAIATGLRRALPARWKIESGDFLVFSSLSIMAALSVHRRGGGATMTAPLSWATVVRRARR